MVGMKRGKLERTYVQISNTKVRLVKFNIPLNGTIYGIEQDDEPGIEK
jgi:hypothetical protein